jgi:hypothetical protein
MSHSLCGGGCLGWVGGASVGGGGGGAGGSSARRTWTWSAGSPCAAAPDHRIRPGGLGRVRPLSGRPAAGAGCQWPRPSDSDSRQGDIACKHGQWPALRPDHRQGALVGLGRLRVRVRRSCSVVRRRRLGVGGRAVPPTVRRLGCDGVTVGPSSFECKRTRFGFSIGELGRGLGRGGVHTGR